MISFLIIAGSFAAAIAVVMGIFWIIDFCDNRARNRRDAIDRRKWAGARMQQIKKTKRP